MFTSYLSLGGNEIGNSARSYGYATTSDCAIGWLMDPMCATLPSALGDSPYNWQNRSLAPWYDPDIPELSERFFGAYIVDARGIEDSTRDASITERAGDGGLISGYRHASREIRVRTMLSAHGEDSLSYGITWLRNVLEPDACGMHGGKCGTSDLRFFVDCPPERGSDTSYTSWVTLRTNYALQEKMAVDVDTDLAAIDRGQGNVPVAVARNLATKPSFEVSEGTVVVRENLNPNPDFVTSSGWIKNSGFGQTDGQLDAITDIPDGTSISYEAVSIAVPAGTYASASRAISVPIGFPAVSLQLGLNAYGGGGIIFSSNVTVQPGETVTLKAEGLLAVETTTGVRSILYARDVIPTGARIIMSEALVENAAVVGDPFSGSTPAAGDFSYEWSGTPNASTSQQVAQGVAGWSTSESGVKAIYSEEWAKSGVASLRTIPDGSRNSSYLILSMSGLTIGETYTFLVTCHLASAQVGTLYPYARSLYTGFDTSNRAQAPNVAGDHELSVTVKASATNTAIVLYNGSKDTDVWWDALRIHEGEPDGNGYFDGGTGTNLTRDGFEYATVWDGAPDASTSTLQVTSTRPTGDHSLRLISKEEQSPASMTVGPLSSSTVAASRLAVGSAEYLSLYTQWATSRAGGSLTVNMSFEDSGGGAVGTPSSVTYTSPDSQAVSGSNGISIPNVSVPSGAQDFILTFSSEDDVSVGDWIEVYQTSVTLESSAFPPFHGGSPSSDPNTIRYVWTGADGESPSEMQTRSAIETPWDDEHYQEEVDKGVRILHGVQCVSGPIINEKFESSVEGVLGVLVEFTLQATEPFVYGVTKPVAVPPTPPQEYQDIPYNRAPYPSMELTSGTVEVGYNFSENPSVEVSDAGWSTYEVTGTGDDPSAFVTGSRAVGELQAVGDASYRVRLLGDGATAASGGSVISARQDVSIPTSWDSVSLNIWGGAVVSDSSGASAINSLHARVYWMNASSSVISSEDLGPASNVNGNPWNMKNVAVPANTVIARVSVDADVDWVSSATPAQNSDIRVYADALAITVP